MECHFLEKRVRDSGGFGSSSSLHETTTALTVPRMGSSAGGRRQQRPRHALGESGKDSSDLPLSSRSPRRSHRSRCFRHSWLLFAVFLLSNNSLATTTMAAETFTERTDAAEERNAYESSKHRDKASRAKVANSGGKIKLKRIRKFIHSTAAEEHRTPLPTTTTTTTTPRLSSKRTRINHGADLNSDCQEIKNTIEVNPAGASSRRKNIDAFHSYLLPANALPFLKRGLLFLSLTSLALLERNPSPIALTKISTIDDGVARLGSSLPLLMSPTRFFESAARQLGKLRFRLDWAKIWSIPNEILPSLTSALIFAWVPSLVMHQAWWELGFLTLSLTSQPSLRQYFVAQVVPSMGATLQKLVWSEFWKRAWDFMLEPFSHNMLMPQVFHPLSFSSSQEGGEPKDTQTQSQRFSHFWKKRVVSRIDTWTKSSMKALLQKNVQGSINGLAEDSWEALVSAVASSSVELSLFYAKDDATVLHELPASTADASGTGEDEAQMVELESDDASAREQDTAAPATCETAVDNDDSDSTIGSSER